MGTRPMLAKSLTHELFVIKEHLQVIPIPKILEYFRGVFNGKLSDMRWSQDILVDRAVESGYEGEREI